MSITICDTHLVRTVRYLSLTFEPVYFSIFFVTVFLEGLDVNKKGRNPRTDQSFVISTRPLRQYYDTENYQRLQHDFE